MICEIEKLFIMLLTLMLFVDSAFKTKIYNYYRVFQRKVCTSVFWYFPAPEKDRLEIIAYSFYRIIAYCLFLL